MSKKTLINIVSIILLIVVLGGVFFLVHSTKSSNDEDQNKVEDKKSENVGPALTGNGDRQDNNSNSDENTEDEKDTKTKKESNNDEKDKSKKDSSKEKSSNSKKDQTSKLTKNADYVYKKTIKGTEDSSEEERTSDIATDKMIKQIEGADSSNASKEVDLRNTSIKFKNTHDFSDKKISGTYKYDLIIKDKENKQGSITKLDETSNIKFIKEDGQYKVDEISK
uniref:Uncharacterized protein n=1 Tax=Staphylococcus sp. CDC3 TaxID=678601 RepID=D2J6X4_9STAP|nr:hypothetical protein SAP020A_030 [Staphylococcus sp. CDC3]